MGFLSNLLGGGSKTQTTSNAPWKPQQQYLTNMFSQAQNLYNKGPQQYYSGQTVAGFSPLQNQAFNSIANPSSFSASQSLLDNTINGGYLGSAPFMQAYGNDILDSVNSQFTRAGRGGSPAAMSAAAEGLGDAASRLYSQERGMQQQAALSAPRLEASQNAQLLQAGGLQQANQQRQLDSNFNRFMFNQNAPTQALKDYQSFISGGFGGQTSQPLHNNRLGGAIGGGLSAFAMSGGNPIAAGIGALGGLL